MSLRHVTAIFAICLPALAAVLWFWPFEAASSVQGGWDNPERFMIAASTESETLTIIDTESATTAGEISLSAPVKTVIVSELGNLAYVAHAKASRLSVVNLETGRLERTTDLPITPLHLVGSAETGVLITNSEQGGMVLVDPYGRDVIFENNSIPPSSEPILSASGTVAYYHSAAGGEVGAVSMETGEVLWRIATPKLTQDVPIVRSVDGLYITVTFSDKGEIAALDSASGKPLALHRFGPGIQQPFVTSNGYYFLVPDPASKLIHVLSQKDFSLQTSIKMEASTPIVVAGVLDSAGLAVSEDGLFALDLTDFKRSSDTKHSMPAMTSDALVTSNGMRAFFAVPKDKSIMTFDMLHNQQKRISLPQSVNIIAMGSTNSICH